MERGTPAAVKPKKSGEASSDAIISLETTTKRRSDSVKTGVRNTTEVQTKTIGINDIPDIDEGNQVVRKMTQKEQAKGAVTLHMMHSVCNEERWNHPPSRPGPGNAKLGTHQTL